MEVLKLDHELVEIQATSVTDGLLVVSNAYSGGWNAYVDGEKVEVLRTNHALQGVPIPAGTHTIELKYEPHYLDLGLKASAASGAIMIGIWGWAVFDWRRRRGAGA